MFFCVVQKNVKSYSMHGEHTVRILLKHVNKFCACCRQCQNTVEAATNVCKAKCVTECILMLQLLSEYCGGSNLGVNLRNHKPVPLETLRHHTEGMLQALHYLHDHTVVHKLFRVGTLCGPTPCVVKTVFNISLCCRYYKKMTCRLCCMINMWIFLMCASVCALFSAVFSRKCWNKIYRFGNVSLLCHTSKPTLSWSA